MAKRLTTLCTGLFATTLTLALLSVFAPSAEAAPLASGRIVKPGGVAPVCGNGIIETGEECDDSNTSNNDGCSSTCFREFCGDGIINGSEQCDDGNQNTGDGCTPDCHTEVGGGPFCGDGAVNGSEECDDGNTTGGDGCSASCHFEKCGNNVVDVGETCDDGNDVSGDGCSSECQTEGGIEFCGDGVVNGSEECDDGNNVSGDGCSSDCHFEKCGNDVLDTGEECDDGNNVDGDGCSSDCFFEKCGNDILDVGEECDDGNNVDGDGCSADCLIEVNPEEGCTPGFWKNHTGHWSGYAPGARIDSAFSAASNFPSLADDSLLDGLRYQGGRDAIGGARILLRAAIAALLNEAHPDVDYSVDGVVALVNAALATKDRATMIGLGGLLDDANNGADGCPLSGGNTNH